MINNQTKPVIKMTQHFQSSFWIQAIYAVFIIIAVIGCSSPGADHQKISLEVYRDKMMGAWLGQMAGVGWGLPTEFDYTDQIVPLNEVPEWNPEMVNQQGNDDLYVEMTFLGSMDRHGLDVSIRQAGIDFANTGYTLWAANKTGRENLRYGIAPPASSHPEFSGNCDDIDYQIEADFSGIIAPGMPQVAVELGEKFGRLMNYGDGLYGGQFIGSMYAAAYFEDDPEQVIRQALKSIPSESHYAQCVRDVLSWHEENPADWQRTWKLIEEKYHDRDTYQQFAKKSGSWVPIDAKLNGAYIVLGLLYGNSNMDSTLVISMRGGKDSDCNPSNAGGVLGTIIGYENMPEKFKSGLDRDRLFSYSDYNFNHLIELSEKFTRELILQNKGSIEADEADETYFLIPHSTPTPAPYTPSYDPGPLPANPKYDSSEMKQINAYSLQHFTELFAETGLRMEVRHCGKLVHPKIQTWNGEEQVIATSPMSTERGVKLMVLEKNIVPAGKKGFLQFKAGHKPGEAWRLKIRTKGKWMIDDIISDRVSKNGWVQYKVDISDYAGEESMNLQLLAEAEDGQLVPQYWTGFTVAIE